MELPIRTYEGTTIKETRKIPRLGTELPYRLRDPRDASTPRPIQGTTSTEIEEDPNLRTKRYEELEVAELELQEMFHTLDALLGELEEKIMDYVQREREQKEEPEEMMRPILELIGFAEKLG